MFENNNRGRSFKRYLDTAKSLFKSVPMAKNNKEATEIAGALSSAIAAGVDIILKGLRDELKTIVRGGSDDMAEKAQETMNLASNAIMELIKVRDMKAGNTHWLHKIGEGNYGRKKKEKTGDLTWVKNSLGTQSLPDDKAGGTDTTPVWLKGSSASQAPSKKSDPSDLIWNRKARETKEKYGISSKQGVPSLTSKLQELEALAKVGDIRKMVDAFDAVVAEILATDFENKAELIRNTVSELMQLLGDERALEMISDSKSFSEIGPILRGEV